MGCAWAAGEGFGEEGPHYGVEEEVEEEEDLREGVSNWALMREKGRRREEKGSVGYLDTGSTDGADKELEHLIALL